jgi:hypothetical protein
MAWIGSNPEFGRLTSIPSPSQSRSLEKLLASLSAAFSLTITARLWMLVTGQQPMWPFPALYLVEVVALPSLAALVTFRGDSYRTRAGFVAAGALSTFSFLGALSVGLFYVPLVLLQLATAVASRVHPRDRLSTSAGLLVGAALLQGVIMFTIVELQS